MLGVFSEYDLRTCVAVLQLLSKEKNTSLELYVEWLGHLQLYVGRQLTEYQSTDVLPLCQIYLPEHREFRPLKDLLVIQDNTQYNPAIAQVSKYLNLAIISPSINQIYWQFKDLFRALDCTCTVSLSHLLKTIHLVSCDRKTFYALGDCETIVKENTIEIMINLYQYLEQLIFDCAQTNKTNDGLFDAIDRKAYPSAPCGSREDLQWRFAMNNDNISKKLKILIGLDDQPKSLPLLTIDQQFVANSISTIIYACMEQKIIERLAKNVGKRYFILPIITQTCPLVLAACGIDYVERRGKVRWINNNFEYFLRQATDIFRETLQDLELKVIITKYVNVKLLLSDSRQLDPKHDDDQKDDVKHHLVNIDYPFWIFDKTIVLCADMKSDDLTKSVIATSALATLLHRRKLKPFEEAKSIARQKIETCGSFYTTVIADIVSIGSKDYSYIDILFPTDHYTIEPNLLLMGKQFDVEQEEDPSVDQTPVVTITRNAEDQIYRQRIKQQDHRNLDRERSSITGL